MKKRKIILVKVELLRDCGVFSEGDVEDMDRPRADQYIISGAAKLFVEKAEPKAAPKKDKPKAKKEE